MDVDAFNGVRGSGRSSAGACVYTIGDKKVPVPTATHYAYRDRRLAGMTPAEFTLAFQVAAITKHDLEWHKIMVPLGKDMSKLRAAVVKFDEQVKSGRRKTRYLLLPGHPLASTHILTLRAKHGVLNLTGGTRPKDVGGEASYLTANFFPWSAFDPRPT